jgi:hypothetical protein
MSKQPLYPHVPGKKHTVIQVVCAWCQKAMGTKEGYGVEGISHSICQECLKKEKDKIRR